MKLNLSVVLFLITHLQIHRLDCFKFLCQAAACEVILAYRCQTNENKLPKEVRDTVKQKPEMEDKSNHQTLPSKCYPSKLSEKGTRLRK